MPPSGGAGDRTVRKIFITLAVWALGCAPVPAPIKTRVPTVTESNHPGGAYSETQGAQGDPTAIALVNGPGYDHRIWAQLPAPMSVIDYLVTAGYAVAAIDLPGSGDATRPPGLTVTLQTQSAALHAALGSLQESYPKVICVGMTGGGLVVIQTRTDYGDCAAAVILSYTPAAHSSGILQVDQDAMTNPMAADPQGYVQIPVRVRSMLGAKPDWALDAPSPLGYTRAWVDSFDSSVAIVDAPILAIYGPDRSPGLAPPRAWPLGCNALVKVYPDTGPILMLAQPTTVIRVLGDVVTWLDSQGVDRVRNPSQAQGPRSGPDPGQDLP